MQGLHLTADLHQCACELAWLTDAERLVAHCEHAVRIAGLQGVARLSHTFAPTGLGPSGVTAAVLLAESHLCVHTWPELSAVTLDVYVCNFGADHSGKGQALMDELITLFAPRQVTRNALLRGAIAPDLSAVLR